MSDELLITRDVLERLARLAEPVNRDLLAAVCGEFGDDCAATLFVLALGMALGSALKVIPRGDCAPDGLTQLFAVIDVPFSLEAKGRVQ
jgi:hypothetical protein